MAFERRSVVRLLLIPALLLVVWSWRGTKLPVSDFSSYWVAGHSLLQHQNPYDAAEALRLERGLGLTRDRPFVMRNPPWILWLTIPIGALDHGQALLLWICALAIALLASARILARPELDPAGKPNHQLRALLTPFIFAPTLICLSVGQTGPLVLLGIVLFMYLHHENEWFAGAALLLAAVKPHIASLFWVVLLLWIVDRKRWRVLLGGAAAGAISILIALVFDPQVFGQYTAMMRSEAIEKQFIPTLGGWLRWHFGGSWLQIAPMCLGVLAAAIYYLRNRTYWNWRERMPILLLASIIVAPYGFLFDEVIVLVALVPIAKHARAPALALFVAANVAILTLMARGVRIVSPFYVWTPWVWLALYLAMNVSSRRRSQATQVAANAT